MIESGFSIEIADFHTDHAALRAVREPVFMVEQQVPPELEQDELDPRCRHVLARDAEGAPIGTARLTPQRSIGRMAVLPAWRGRGVGDALLQALLDLARGLGWSEVTLHAQVSAIGFYQRAGFEPVGEEFVEAGIRHRSMRLVVEPFPEVPRAPAAEMADSREQNIESLQHARELVLQMLGQARRQVWLYARDLDPLLFGTHEALESIKRFALGGRDRRLLVLLHDPGAVLRVGHGLIPLAHRLPTAIQMRAVQTEQDLKYPGAFLIDDQGGYLFRPIGSRFEGNANLHAPGRQRQLREYFNQVWERSLPSPELRQLHV